MFRPGELEVSFRALAQEELGADAEEEKLAARAKDVLAGLRTNDPVAKETFDLRQLYDAPVIAADDVAAYALSLPKGTRMDDVVASMAPPFEKFFVEFQKIPNEDMLHAWGALVESRDDPGTIEQIEGDIGKPRWILELTSFLEREKGKPFGPVATHVVGLAEDGTWFRHSDGGVWWGGGPVKMNVEPPEEVVQNWGDFMAQLMFPVLLSISFMHCKNVEIRPVVPPEKLSRKHHKVYGHELVRYHVLDVQPIRRILDRYRKGTRDDLRRALHICRGHFKTFSPDAPLLGRHVGTYWWEPQVRGSKERGTVLKDYRVNALREFGKAYREADENPPNPEKEAPPSKDPDSTGRGLSAHNRIQNQIAELLQQLGIEPLSPTRDEPEFDIAWKTGETFYVCEIKSITALNEERQLRMAIGQVIRYRQKLAACGHEPIATVVATERRPSESSWQDLCENEGILLLWPDVAQTRLKELAVAGGNGKGNRL
jgi:hypothetical protein